MEVQDIEFITINEDPLERCYLFSFIIVELQIQLSGARTF